MWRKREVGKQAPTAFPFELGADALCQATRHSCGSRGDDGYGIKWLFAVGWACPAEDSGRCNSYYCSHDLLIRSSDRALIQC